MGRHCERSEAPIKRPLSRGKKSPQHEFLIFRSANYGYLNPGERHLRQCRNFFSDDVSALAGTLLHQAPIRIWVRGWVFFRLFVAPVILVRGVYLVPKSQAILTPSVYRRTRKSSVPNRVQEDEQSHGFTSFEWLTAWAAKMPFPL